jgi:hypothetical protein
MLDESEFMANEMRASDVLYQHLLNTKRSQCLPEVHEVKCNIINA